MIVTALVPLFAIAADVQGKFPGFVRRIAPLGCLTYSIYMIHGLLILVVLNAVGDKLLGLTDAPVVVLAALTYGLIFIISLWSYRWLEMPCRRWIDGWRIFRRARV